MRARLSTPLLAYAVVPVTDSPDDPASGPDAGAEPATDDSAGATVDDGRGLTEPDPTDQDPVALWVRADWYVCLGLVLISFVLVGLHVRAYPTLSPIDELQHVDYVIRAGEFDIPRRNERVEFEAMDEAACRSVDAPGYEGPPCGLDEYDPTWFQEKGFNTAASQFPPYYVVTGVVARGLTEVGIFDSKVTAARMLGAIWAGAAWSVTWYLVALLGVRRRYRAAALALLLPTPLIIFHAGATVNADVSLMLSGALAVLATMKYEAGRLRWWWLIPIYTGLFFVEATNILAIAACGLYLIARRGLDTTLSWQQRLAPLLVLPGLALLRLQVAKRVQDALFPAVARPRADDRLSSAPMFVNHQTDEVSVDKILAQLETTFTPVRNPYFSPPLRSQFTIAGIQLTNWLLIALMFATAFVVATSIRAIWWARITLLTLLLAGPFYTFYFAYFSSRDYPAPARFALPLVPMMVVAAACGIRNRATLVVVGTVAGLTVLNTVYQLVTAL